MKVHKMTKWDEGQVLIKASDCLFDCAAELRETQPGLADMLRRMGAEIGTEFNSFGSHGFYLRDLESCGIELKEKQLRTERDEILQVLGDCLKVNLISDHWYKKHDDKLRKWGF